MDGLLLNLFLCLLFVGGVILGVILDQRAFYPAAAVYVLQFLEYCCSSTRQVINNIENVDHIKNLLKEYQKWRPVIFFHYRFKEEIEN